MSWSSVRSMRCFGYVAAIIVAGTFSISAQAQPPGGGFGRGGPGGGFGGGGGGFGGPLVMLQREDVQQELELLEDQKTQLKAMGEKSRERMGELFRGRGGAGGGGDQGRDELRETFRKLNEETQADVDKILLPHQSKRLKQLEVQMRMRGRVMGALDGDVAQQLGINEAQQDKLREKAQSLEQELRKKMAEVRKQLQDQLLAELSPEQRKQFNDMVGDPFEFKDEAPPGGGFGGPGGGTFGGNREQGRGGNDRRRRPDEQK